MKRMSLNILSYKNFLFLNRYVFYLLFNAILCESKLQFLILSRNSTVHLYCANPVLNLNIKAFKSYTELRMEIEQFLFGSLHNIFILLPKQ